MGVIPDYIIGDLDSAKKPTISYFKQLGKTKIIKNTDQDKTDLELALSLAESLDPQEINIFGALGKRMDHTLANIYCLDKIKPEIKARIIDDTNTIELIRDNVEIIGKKNDILSIIPISDVSNLNYNGLKWNVENLDTKTGWFGISNRFENKSGTISFSKGKILVIRVRE